MKKTMFVLGFALMLIAVIGLVMGVVVKGFMPGGKYTGDDKDSDIPKRNVYCKVYVEGEWNVGSNIKLSQLQCRTDEPFFMAENLAIFTAAKDVECTGYLIKNNQVVSTSNRKSFGDLGVTDEVWYKFGISQVPIGAYTVRVTCESQTDPTDTTTIEKDIDVS